MIYDLPFNAGDMGSIPSLGSKIPGAVGQLSLCAAIREALELQLLNLGTLQLDRSPHTTMKSLRAATKTQHSQRDKKRRDLMYSLYTVHGIPQARILEWVAILFSRGSSQPRDQTQIPHTAGGFFTT